MLVTSSFVLLLGGAVSLFLAGVNFAFLLQLGGRLVGWFKFYVSSISLLLVYTSESFVFGDPAWSRVIVGWAALAFNLLAVFWMWTSIEHARDAQVIGLVPLIKQPDEEA